MSLYVLQFEWSGEANLDDRTRRPLEADGLDDAKFEAALAFAMNDFKGDPPSAYCILDAAHREVYRYPEGYRPRA